MLHEMKYTLKTLFRSREFMFWTVAFPLILATFFYLAFSNLTKNKVLEPISIAVIDDEAFQSSHLKEVMENISNPDSENYFFDLHKVKEEEQAKTMILENEIVGYVKFGKTSQIAMLRLGGKPQVVLGNQSIEATLFHQIITQMYQMTTALTQVVMGGGDMEEMVAKAVAAYQVQNYEIVEKGKISANPIVISFYSLIAMTCMYGAIIGMVVINSVLPNMSQIGKRVFVSPSRKYNLVLGSAIGGYIGQSLASSILFLYLVFILRVEFGTNLFLVYLFTLLGNFAGLSFGMFLACVITAKEEVKIGIIISVSMLGSFLSGMMSSDVKFYVDSFVPFLNWVNPSNMITDGLYALSFYSTYTRFRTDVLSLAGFTFVMFLISIWALRRQSYDSI